MTSASCASRKRAGAITCPTRSRICCSGSKRSEPSNLAQPAQSLYLLRSLPNVSQHFLEESQPSCFRARRDDTIRTSRAAPTWPRTLGMEYQIQPNSRRCAATGKEMQAGERFFSALVEEDRHFVRK